MAFYVGRVLRTFQGSPERLDQKDLSPYIDRRAKTITSITGELKWDYGAAIVTVDTPKAQGAAGFLAQAGPIDLATVTITMENPYGTVTVVSLDDRPLAQSREILIQCMTVDQPYGWKSTMPDGHSGTIVQVGAAPWGMQKIKASLTLKWPGASRAQMIACDEHGYPTDTVIRSQAKGKGINIQIPESNAYTIVTR